MDANVRVPDEKLLESNAGSDGQRRTAPRTKLSPLAQMEFYQQLQGLFDDYSKVRTDGHKGEPILGTRMLQLIAFQLPRTDEDLRRSIGFDADVEKHQVLSSGFEIWRDVRSIEQAEMRIRTRARTSRLTTRTW